MKIAQMQLQATVCAFDATKEDVRDFLARFQKIIDESNLDAEMIKSVAIANLQDPSELEHLIPDISVCVLPPIGLSSGK
jgi:hypothetical protein